MTTTEIGLLLEAKRLLPAAQIERISLTLSKAKYFGRTDIVESNGATRRAYFPLAHAASTSPSATTKAASTPKAAAEPQGGLPRHAKAPAKSIKKAVVPVADSASLRDCVIRVLQGAGRPLTTREIAAALLEDNLISAAQRSKLSSFIASIRTLGRVTVKDSAGAEHRAYTANPTP
jgi:hypothetical protein